MLSRSHSRSLFVVALVLTAGCTALAGGGGDLSYAAGPISVADAAVSESGFTLASDESFNFEQTLEVAGQERTVQVNADMIHLQRDYGVGTPASVVILSIPEIKLLGQQISLAKRIGPMSLVERAGASVGDLERDQKQGEREVSILGDQRTVEVFSGSAKRNGQQADVLIFMTTFTHNDDTIVAIGLTPQAADGGDDAVLRVFRGIRRG